MNLELFANELLLEIFDYLNVVDLLRAFRGLNHRFDELLAKKRPTLHLNFRKISKDDFDEFCHNQLPSIVDQIESLHFSNDIETPTLIESFLLSNPSMIPFTNVKSLVIYHMDCFETLNSITERCHDLVSLIHLSISMHSTAIDTQDEYRHFINHIWSLKKLIRCHLDINYLYTTWLLRMSIRSQSIKYLTTNNIDLSLSDIAHLFEYTPNLRQLLTGCIASFHSNSLATVFTSMRSLNLTYSGLTCSMTYLFQQMPHLIHLTIDTHTVLLDGFGWQKIIRDDFPKLKTFRLRMSVEFSILDDRDEQIDQLLDSFRTTFWIEERQWFVRFHWRPMVFDENGLLYTLPYSFDRFDYSDSSSFKSTCPNDLTYSSYDRVRILQQTSRKKNVDDHLPSFPIQFNQIEYLLMNFPCDQFFQSVCPRLNRLLTLNTMITDPSGYSYLQTLIDRSPQLYTLIFHPLNHRPLNSFNIRSSSIRSLDLSHLFKFSIRYLSTAECDVLFTSSLLAQCEVLSIDVEHRSNIPRFLQTMNNLRALKFRAKDIDESTTTTTKTELIHWLSKYLSSSSSHVINLDERNKTFIVYLWISKKTY